MSLLIGLIRNRLAIISVATGMGAEALDGAAVDLPPHIQAEMLVELDTLAGRLDLVLDRLASAADPVGLAGSHSLDR
jgi:hypothetical protein